MAPSAIMISKASRTDGGGGDQHGHTLSPTLSVGSRGSYDGWALDKEIISRTYDKYQSFSPFKVGCCTLEYRRGIIIRRGWGGGGGGKG